MIACYSENLDWAGDIPGDFDATICNEGAEIMFAPAPKRVGRIVAPANSGRESDTRLRHVLNNPRFRDGFSVFLQGDALARTRGVDADREGGDVVVTACVHVGCDQPGMLAREAGCGHYDFSCVARPWADDLARSEG